MVDQSESRLYDGPANSESKTRFILYLLWFGANYDYGNNIIGIGSEFLIYLVDLVI